MPSFKTVTLCDKDSALVILDQTALPGRVRYLHLYTLDEICGAIYHLKVRGAPAVGVAAAMGLYLSAKAIDSDDYQTFFTQFSAAKETLAAVRPTAVNLRWALDLMEWVVMDNHTKPVGEIKVLLLKQARLIKRRDTECCRKIGEFGLSLLKPGMGILTHCNAGALATCGIGTATAPIYLGQEQGVDFRVYADETRPLLQGARLTAWELDAAGIDVTLICDNMAAKVMAEGKIQAVLVGCDRVAANGDTANKIGTFGLAVLAKNFKIPFYVCAPTSTIDKTCACGDDIVIEQRPGTEITHMWYENPLVPPSAKVYNPSFDVTPHGYITAFITEHGIVTPPFIKKLCDI